MSIQAIHHHRILGRHVIDQLMGRKLRGSPILVVPASIQDPLAFRARTRECRNAFPEFTRRLCIAQLDARQAHTACIEMHMSIVEPGQNASATQVDDFGLRANELLNFGRSSDFQNIAIQDSDRLGFGLSRVLGPDLTVQHRQIRVNGGPCRRRQQEHGENKPQ